MSEENTQSTVMGDRAGAEDEVADSELETARVERKGRLRSLGERGMVSAEWAVGIIAAIAVAGVLLGVVTSGSVKSALLAFILQVIETFSKHL